MTYVSAVRAADSNSRVAAGWLLVSWLLATMGLWLFAFYEVPTEAPDWVRRAQIACFGSDESGLPAASGWLLLVLSPAMFLGALVFALGDEVFGALRSIRTAGRIRQLLCAGLVVALVTQAGWVANVIYARQVLAAELVKVNLQEHLPSNYPRTADQAPLFKLTDQHGKEISLAVLRGKPVLVTYVFAHCRSVCPALVTTVSDAARRLGESRVHALFITLDPWRDTPGALPGLAARWEMLEPHLVLLSGEPAKVIAVLDEFKVPRQRDEGTGDVAHPALVHVLAPDGTIAYAFNNPSIPWLIEAVDRVS